MRKHPLFPPLPVVSFGSNILRPGLVKKPDPMTTIECPECLTIAPAGLPACLHCGHRFQAVTHATPRPSRPPIPAKKWICPRCGTMSDARSQPDGSCLIEGLLWLCFIIPGLIYSLWRFSTYKHRCSGCKSPMIRTDSPEGMRQLARYR